MAAVAERRPDYDPELRRRALEAYRRHRSYRKAGAAIGVSHKRCHVLVREALRLELEEAKAA